MATTKEVAANLNITGKELRRILRSFDRFADGTYTRYNLGKRDIEQVTKALENRAPKPTHKKGQETGQENCSQTSHEGS